MRTTLDIADDVLVAAKELARREGKTAGQVLSELARGALTGEAGPVGSVRTTDGFLGFRPFPRRGGVVTSELVARLRDDLPLVGPPVGDRQRRVRPAPGHRPVAL